MTATCEKNKQIKSLQGMMDRLGAEDLTLAESLNLQPKLFELLRAIERSEAVHEGSNARGEEMGDLAETLSREGD